MILRLGAVTLVAAFLPGLVPAQAATERREPTRFDDRIRHREGGAIAVLPRPLDSFDASDPLRVRWEEFRARYGAGWTVYLDDRTGLPSMVSGPGIPWVPEGDAAGATLESLDRLARGFVEENAPVLGAWSDLLDLDREASGRVGDDRWQLVYRQRVDGVRVENARLDVHVVRGRMVLMGAENWARPKRGGAPALDALRAGDALEAYLGDRAERLDLVEAPRPVLIAVDADRSGGEPRAWARRRGEGIDHVLVWRFLLDEAGGASRWVGEVDAGDGSVSAFYERTQHATARGGIFPIAPDGDCAHGGCEVDGFPLPFADFTEAGLPKAFADSFGNLACHDPESGFTSSLQGPYVRIADACGAVSEPGSCASGADLGLKAGENCAVAPGASAGNTSASRTAYYHVNRVAQVARFYAPANAWLQGALTVNVNVDSSCNANWDGSAVNMFRAGGRCSNTAENAGVLVHEWGHGFDANDGGGVDKPSEAYSDIVAILTTRASCVGRGMYNDGGTCSGYGDTCLTCTGFRDFDWDARQSHAPATPTSFVQPRCATDSSGFAGPCRREPHCESYLSSEAIFDLATRDLPAAGVGRDSAWQIVDRLWYLTRPGSGGNAYTCLLPNANSCGATSWYQRMRVADDDDGNLANGTPHAAALFAAFNRHKLACGAATDATNQSTSTCAALAAPVVTRAAAPSGIQLSWNAVAGAAEYRVYRGELGCDRQMVPIAALPGGQTSYVDDSGANDLVRRYRVEAFGANRACFGPVSDCVSAPPGSRLHTASYRVVDDGDGIPEPGETITLPVSLGNTGADAATSASGSLKPVGPPDVRILTPAATWPTIEAGATVESDPPHFRIVILQQASCGDTLVMHLSGAAANSPPFSDEIRIPMGSRTRDYTETAIVPIPYVTSAPVETYFDVPDDRPIADLDITIDIFHQDPTQLIVDLRSPHGTTVRLHDRTGGNGHGIETRFDRDTAPDGPGAMADFAGESTMGRWTLSVQDVDPTGETTDGYVRTRTLNATVVGAFDCVPQTCADPAPDVAPDLTVRLTPNGAALDLELSWTPVSGAAGYHVLQSTDPALRSGVDLIGVTTSGTALTVPDGGRTTPDRTYFQARAVNSCHQEGP